MQAVVSEPPGLVSVHLAGRHLDEFRARAGQFLLLRLLGAVGAPGASRAHPYSLSAAPTDRLLRVTVKDPGDDSRRVARLRPGIGITALRACPNLGHDSGSNGQAEVLPLFSRW